MNVIVHNLMAYNHQFFRPQPVVDSKSANVDQNNQSFQEVLKEKMRAQSGSNNK